MWGVVTCSDVMRNLHPRRENVPLSSESAWPPACFLLPTLLYFPSLNLSDRGLVSGRGLGNTRSSKPSSSQLGGWKLLGEQEPAQGHRGSQGWGPTEKQGSGLQAAILPSCLGAPSRMPANIRLAKCMKGILQDGLLIINAYIFSGPQAKSHPRPLSCFQG